MSEGRVERRLAAILVADVVGYSRLMGRDEEGTLASLKAIRAEVGGPKIAEHRGRLVKTTGDGFLVEFPSVVDAVRCAVELQEAMAERNGTIPEDRRIAFRIGINLGDVIADQGDIFGDGVNIAARLEGLAESGGICISARVHEDAAGKVDAIFEDIGEPELKNIGRPVRVYRVRLRTSSQAPAAAPALALPDKPSIAVLPFHNMSGDPEQEYFADGMVEEIITALSGIRWLFVIARNSTFTYKGRAADIKRVAEELGVRYVVEGSVRKAGNRVRIAAQLIDSEAGTHLWADRFDGSLEDVFDLQDQIARSVAGAIQPSVRSAEIARSRRKRPESLDAYDLVLQAYPFVWSLDRASNGKALKLLDRALALEPDYPLALSLVAWCHAQQIAYNWTLDPAKSRDEVLRTAEAAASAATDDPTILTGLGAAYAIVRNHVLAERLLQRALLLDPSSAWAWNRSGWVHCYLDHPEVAVEHFERALRLSPFDPMNFNALVGIGVAHLGAERLDAAALCLEKALLDQPAATWIYRTLVPVYALLGREAEANAGLERLRAEYPDLTITKVVSALPVPQATLDLTAAGLRKAGLPD